MSSILFTICGRAGSKGISGKNLGGLLGVPLVYYTLAAIEGFQEFRPDVQTEIALSTDSDALRALVDRTAIPYCSVERPERLANDTSSKVDAIAHAWRIVQKAQSREFSFVIDLDLTSPLRTVADVNNIYEKRLSSSADTVFSVVPSRRNPCFNMVRKQDDGYYGRVISSSFNTRQEAPKFFDMNASIYAYAPAFLASGKQIFEGTCDIVEMRDTAVLDLDEPGDLELMEAVAAKLFEVDKGMGRVAARARALARRLRA